MKISIQDIKNNKYYNSIFLSYSVILAAVYGYWMYKSGINIWFAILISLCFIFIGISLCVYSTVKLKKKNLAAIKESVVPIEAEAGMSEIDIEDNIK
ncbi:MAG: hypothetical protein ACRC5M_02140 [Anaeroplasmataceae bacterium]